MAPRPQGLQVDKSVTGLQVTPGFADNSTQSEAVETATTGIQTISRGVDAGTQTIGCCKCNCANVIQTVGAATQTLGCASYKRSESNLKKAGSSLKKSESSSSLKEMFSKIRVDLKSALELNDVEVDTKEAAKKVDVVAKPAKMSLLIPPPPPLPAMPALVEKSLLPNFVHKDAEAKPAADVKVTAIPPPPPLPTAAIPPPPPLPVLKVGAVPPPPPLPMGAIPPPPPPPMMGASTFPSMKPGVGNAVLRKSKTLPQQSTIKMKTLNWTKVPKQKIAKSLWSDSEVQLPILKVDFSEMEELFCQQQPTKSADASKNQLAEKKVQKVNLLDSQRSFLVNIFLKQFKENVEFVLDSIKNGAGLPVENLKSLMKLMPEKKEIAEIRAHSSSKNLGEAEIFYLHLSDIADYELRVQAMLFKQEFHERYSDASEHLEKVIETCEFLINDCSLKQFLLLILQLGNKLNAGTYAGNADAIKISSLAMLSDTRANKPKISFLHYVVDVAASNDASMLAFRSKVADFQRMSKTPFAALELEVNSLMEGVNDISKRIKSSKVSSQFGDFFHNAKQQVHCLVKKLKKIREVKSQLAVHFCEEPAAFQLNDCYQLFADFFTKVNKVMQENDQMKKTEEKAAKSIAEKSTKNEVVKVKKRQIFDRKVEQLINEAKNGAY
ncbi:inverted formin-2-like [Nilaparvata lugens]|uniref:inverted formin-2-like n=1 Tax=Nilaparvata lugens TaxID=108931 RepID=UPI00193EB98A|nr:inverted formin-2-like [Nilaparvata lugens]XP_039287213.1 inverted formin-2-like [Nilaparvata lugens]